MRQIVEWLFAAAPLIAVLILVLMAVNEGWKLKRASYERYVSVENVRRALDMERIPWRGSFTQYSEDVSEAQKRKRD